MKKMWNVWKFIVRNTVLEKLCDIISMLSGMWRKTLDPLYFLMGYFLFFFCYFSVTGSGSHSIENKIIDSSHPQPFGMIFNICIVSYLKWEENVRIYVSVYMLKLHTDIGAFFWLGTAHVCLAM